MTDYGSPQTSSRDIDPHYVDDLGYDVEGMMVVVCECGYWIDADTERGAFNLFAAHVVAALRVESDTA